MTQDDTLNKVRAYPRLNHRSCCRRIQIYLRRQPHKVAVRLCAALKLTELFEVEGARVPQCSIAGNANAVLDIVFVCASVGAGEASKSRRRDSNAPSIRCRLVDEERMRSGVLGWQGRIQNLLMGVLMYQSYKHVIAEGGAPIQESEGTLLQEN